MPGQAGPPRTPRRRWPLIAAIVAAVVVLCCICTVIGMVNRSHRVRAAPIGPPAARVALAPAGQE